MVCIYTYGFPTVSTGRTVRNASKDIIDKIAAELAQKEARWRTSHFYVAGKVSCDLIVAT